MRGFFVDRRVEVFTWPAGPALAANPHLRVLRVAPQQRGGVWTYVTVGGWAGTPGDAGLELILCTAAPEERAVELLAMATHYHRGGVLGLGHTVPVGEPWLPGSACDHLLVSLPYPFGPDLQTAHVRGRHVEFLWLLPITAAERDLKMTAGLEELEVRFEQAGLRYWQPDRASVV